MRRGRTRRAAPGCSSSTGRTRPASCPRPIGRCCSPGPSGGAGGSTTRRSSSRSRGWSRTSWPRSRSSARSARARWRRRWARPPRRVRPGVSWWERSQVKRVCEWMFGMGLLTTGTRVHFQRLYDLPERVLPPEVLSAPAPSPEEAARRLVRQAAVAPRRGHRARPARLLPAGPARRAGRPWPSSSRPGSWSRSRCRAGGCPPIGCPARGCRGGSPGARCCARSTR